MFHNYLITALRNFFRHKLYSFINIAGLTVGLTCTIFIILFVREQLSYDRWIPDTDNLYRVEATSLNPGQAPTRLSTIAFPVTQAMLEQIPEVKARTRLVRTGVSILIGDKVFPEKMDVVDPNFLQVIKLPLVSGMAATALMRPDSIILSQENARKYFGDAAALGKTLIMSAEYCDPSYDNCEIRRQTLTVTGILRDLPHNTQLAVNLLMPNISDMAPISDELRTNWSWFSGWGYVRLAPGTDPAAVIGKINAIFDRSFDPSKQMNVKLKGSQVLIPHLTPFLDDHLSTDKYDGGGGGSMTPPGSWATVYGFGAIGVLILLLACFNFTNLATARAIVRAREISLRKVVGATRWQLMVQFLGESMLMALIALILALALVEMLLPAFDRFLNMPIAFRYFQDWPLLLFILGIGLLTGLLGGIYPALVLSGFRPAMALRRSSANRQGVGLTRTTLVVMQFAVSIGLGIAALVIFAQISFARSIDLGFQPNGVLVLNTGNLPQKATHNLALALRASSAISDTAFAQSIPLDNDHNNWPVRLPGSAMSQTFVMLPASPTYMQLLGIRLLAGRFLSEQRASDMVNPSDMISGKLSVPANILINASGVHRLGLTPQQAVGKTLILWNGRVTVAGVVADVKADGPGSLPTGTVYVYWSRNAGSNLSVRIRNGRTHDAMTFIERTWRAFAPSVALQWHFLDDDYNKQFQTEERQGTIFGLFVGIAVVIAAMGLFGLAAFSTERRTREIGIRKTFGARTRDIVLMLLWQFSIPVLVANLIAWPVAYYYLHHWLEGYAYRISLSPFYFIAAGVTALVIAWATVIVHAAQVAKTNPIHALRYE
jgi:putative ABC transport system permease protein